MSKNHDYTLPWIKILCVCPSDLYVSVGGALSRIIIKDGNHPASSWGRVTHSGGGGGLAGICQSNREGANSTVWHPDN